MDINMISKIELEHLLLIFIYFKSKFKVTFKNGDFECQWKEIESRVTQYKQIGYHGINNMTLIKDDDMYNVSSLNWKGTPDGFFC